MKARWVLLLIGSLASPIIPCGHAEEWLRMPADVARFKLERFGGAVSQAEYRVIVDVPAKGGGPTRIAKSSGERAVDAIALDYADAHVEQVPRLKEMHATKEMRFPLLIDLREQSRGDWHTEMVALRSQYRTRIERNGFAAVRVFTGSDGRVKEARMMVGVGSGVIDAEVIDYARKHWTGPPNSSKVVRVPFRTVHGR